MSARRFRPRSWSRTTFEPPSALANGRSESCVRDRTAWKDSRMLDRYRRIARTIKELHLTGCGGNRRQGTKWRRRGEDESSVILLGVTDGA
jgi:hypothetical protein